MSGKQRSWSSRTLTREAQIPEISASDIIAEVLGLVANHNSCFSLLSTSKI
jgi:hypothetical protein